DSAAMLSYAMSGIEQTTAQTRDSMDQMRAAMDQLVELAHSLLRAINVFRIGGSRAYEPPLTGAVGREALEPTTRPPLSTGGSSSPLRRLAPPALEATLPRMGGGGGKMLGEAALSGTRGPMSNPLIPIDGPPAAVSSMPRMADEPQAGLSPDGQSEGK